MPFLKDVENCSGTDCAQRGDIEMLTSCSEAELNSLTSSGETPTDYAVEKRTSWSLKWLLEKGFDTPTLASNGYTPEQVLLANTCIQEGKLQRRKVEGLDKDTEDSLFLLSTAGFLDNTQKKLCRYPRHRLGAYKLPCRLPSQREHLLKPELPREKSQMPAAMLFPGQGSQYVGMLAEASKLPAVKSMLSKAQKILGWDILELCTNGPEAKLSATKYCQPVLFVAGLAAVEVLREKKKEVVERPQAVAGLSLGEYMAICAAGVLEFEDCLRLVQLRGEAMQDAANVSPQGMASIVGLDKPALQSVCREAAAADSSVPNPVCQIATNLFSTGFACAGHKSTIDKLCEKALAAGALKARAGKGGAAFHCPLMQPAADRLSKAIDAALPKMKPPRCCIYLNVTGKKVLPGTPPKEFVNYLKTQLTGEVLWEQTVKEMIKDQVKDFYVTGPLKQITAMIEKIDQDAFKRTENILV